MLMSRYFGRTLREDPVGATTASHRLLVRSGMIQQLGAGIYSYLPAAYRALARIEQIVAEEMDRIDGQRIEMPVVHPADLWKQSRRWYDVGDEMVRFHDRQGHDMVLAMTHEEVVADLAAAHISSYRDLPVMVYQIQTKFRDEPRSRAGLVRVREFAMKDAYSLHCDEDQMRAYYARVVDAYVRIFRRCGLEAVVVESSTGMMGGSTAHEFMLLDPSGEDTVLVCPGCGYAANQEVARARPAAAGKAEPLPLHEVATPGARTIDQVARFLEIDPAGTAKAVFYHAGGELVFALIRGDRDVNEAKLAAHLQSDLKPAESDLLERAGVVAGFASPVGLSGPRVVVDRSVAETANLVGGANRPDYHLANTNYPRDYEGELCDISQVIGGDGCPQCDDSLLAARAVELGNTFQLGYGYSQKRGALYLDPDGQQRPFFMCSYGIGIGRILGTVIERWNDRNGMILPASIAPWNVHIVQLGESPAVAACAIELERSLGELGLQVLRDDRDLSAGVKFNDADLLGLPIRLTVSTRNLKADQVELKLRDSSEREMFAITDVAGATLDRHHELLSRTDPERQRWDPLAEIDTN